MSDIGIVLRFLYVGLSFGGAFLSAFAYSLGYLPYLLALALIGIGLFLGLCFITSISVALFFRMLRDLERW